MPFTGISPRYQDENLLAQGFHHFLKTAQFSENEETALISSAEEAMPDFRHTALPLLKRTKVGMERTLNRAASA